MDLKNCLTSKAAANELRITSSTLAHWRVAGKGPAYIKYGYNVYYDRAVIETYKKEYARTYTSTAHAKVDAAKKGKR